MGPYRVVPDYRLPKDEKERQAFAETIGADGHLLIQMIYSQAPDWLRSIPVVETMRQIWVQQYYFERKSVGAPRVLYLLRMISSPHDNHE